MSPPNYPKDAQNFQTQEYWSVSPIGDDYLVWLAMPVFVPGLKGAIAHQKEIDKNKNKSRKLIRTYKFKITEFKNNIKIKQKFLEENCSLFFKYSALQKDLIKECNNRLDGY